MFTFCVCVWTYTSICLSCVFINSKKIKLILIKYTLTVNTTDMQECICCFSLDKTDWHPMFRWMSVDKAIYSLLLANSSTTGIPLSHLHCILFSGDVSAKILIPWRISYVLIKLICSLFRRAQWGWSRILIHSLIMTMTMVGSYVGVNGLCQ